MADDQRTQNAPESGHQDAAPSGAAATEPGPPAADPRTSYLPAAADPLLGQTLAGRYLIVKKLGEGGMGSVYLATHNVLEKQVALKVLHGELARKPDLIERFMQEAKAASRIRHSNVIDISDFGATSDGHVFFAMELLSGHDLHEEIGRARMAGELLPWERSKHIFLQICAALAAAHKHGVVHRDLKPENVYLVDMLGDPDFVKLLDFGIAKLTEVENSDRKLTKTGMLFGTPEYMSPEQARGEKVDHRVDIYAMGCILFQLVTGRVPFEADNFMGVLTMHLTEPPPIIPDEVFDSIGAPRELAGVIAQAIAKDRAHRYQTAEELGNAVRLVCGEEPVTAGNSGRFHQRAPSVPAPAETTQRATPLPSALQAAAARIVTPVPSASGSMPASVAASASGATFRATPPAGSAALPASEAGAEAMEASASGAALRATPPGGSAARPASEAGRSRTWAGTPSVPAADEPAPKKGSKVPLAIGALVLAGGAAAAVFVMQNGSGPAAPSEPGSASGAVAEIDAAVPDAAVAVAVAPPPPQPPPPPPPEPLPEKVTVMLDSTPHGAIVKDLNTGAVFGKTPRKFPVTPGRMPRQYLLTLPGYADAQIELVPDREKIEHTEELVKGVSGRPTVVKSIGPKRPDPGTQVKPPDPGTQVKPPDPGTQTKPPDPGTQTKPPDPGTQTKPPDPGTQTKPPDPPPPKPPPDEDCPELPCLKSDPSRRGGGGGGGSSAP